MHIRQYTFNSYMFPREVRRYWKTTRAERLYLSSGTWRTVTLATWNRKREFVLQIFFKSPSSFQRLLRQNFTSGPVRPLTICVNGQNKGLDPPCPKMSPYFQVFVLWLAKMKPISMWSSNSTTRVQLEKGLIWGGLTMYSSPSSCSASVSTATRG